MGFTAKKTQKAASNIVDQKANELSREKTRARDTEEAAINRLRQMSEGFKFDRVAQDRPQEIQDIINRRKAQSEQGLNAQEYQALRESRLGGLRSANLGQQRQQLAQQARFGLAGPAAAQQMAGLLAQQQAARQQAERDLLLENVAQRQQALQGYESSLGKAREDELARQQFNIGLTGREAMLRMSPETLAAQLAGQRFGTISQEQLAQENARKVSQMNPQPQQGLLGGILQPILGGLF